jgi:ribosome recycling factor
MNSYKEIIDKIKPELDKAINFLERELAKIRTGKATPSLVEDIEVECFGQKFLLKQLAAISISGPRQILIQPWDKSYLEPIEKAVQQSTVGTSPIVDKDLIRLSLPPLSEDYRKNLLKILLEKMEEARKTIRHWREEAWDKIQEEAKEGEIREDDKFRAKDDLQNLIDEYNQKIEETGERKKKEISS